MTAVASAVVSTETAAATATAAAAIEAIWDPAATSAETLARAAVRKRQPQHKHQQKHVKQQQRAGPPRLAKPMASKTIKNPSSLTTTVGELNACFLLLCYSCCSLNRRLTVDLVAAG